MCLSWASKSFHPSPAATSPKANKNTPEGFMTIKSKKSAPNVRNSKTEISVHIIKEP